MTKEAKLQKIVDKAVEGGYNMPPAFSNPKVILFDKSFAQSIWGSNHMQVYKGEWNPKTKKEKNLWSVPAYFHYLQQAVISDEPLDYYYENMPKKKH